jgi:hypothetical protein
MPIYMVYICHSVSDRALIGAVAVKRKEESHD